MARLFGRLANRPDLVAKGAVAEASLLAETVKDHALGWGVGFYQGGELLLKRRPIDDRSRIVVADAVSDVRTDTLIGHVRNATIGAMSTENTHPFRYRQWLFAHTGTISGFPVMRDRLVESIPQFLRRNVRGDTDSELLFHLFLSFLHDSGRLQDAEVGGADVRSALRATMSLVDRLTQEEGLTPRGQNLLLTDGEQMVAMHGAANMAYRVYAGQHDLEELLGEDGLRPTRVQDIATARVCLLVADYDGDASRFTTVPERSILTMTRGADPVVEAI